MDYRSVSAETIYRQLRRVRRVEEEVARVYPTDKIKSPVHLSIGQEAASVGVCAALAPSDVVFGSYRGHALFLAKGGDLKRFLAELYGKATGVAKGKGGSMHLVERSAGVMGTSAVVGTTIPHAVGFALAQKMRRTGAVTASFFGDGATEEGVFYESLNFAVLQKLPVLFICENNLYAIHSRLEARQASPIAVRAAAFGVAVARVEDGDVFEVERKASAAVDELRHGRGPRFLEVVSYRWKEHVGPNDDFQAGYRSRNEAEPWLFRDPVKAAASKLDELRRRTIEEEIEREIREAFEFAESSPLPADRVLYEDMYG